MILLWIGAGFLLRLQDDEQKNGFQSLSRQLNLDKQTKQNRQKIKCTQTFGGGDGSNGTGLNV